MATPQLNDGETLGAPITAQADQKQQSSGPKLNEGESLGEVYTAPEDTMPTRRPQSAKEMEQAQRAGGYSEASERNGHPVTYLVQKPDEDYPTFMKRAAAHGKTVTQEQMKDEAYQPKKIADATVVKPAEYGIGGMAALTGLAEGGSAMIRGAAPYVKEGLSLAAEYGEYGAQKLMELAAEHPVAAKIVGHAAATAAGSVAGGLGTYKAIKSMWP